MYDVKDAVATIDGEELVVCVESLAETHVVLANEFIEAIDPCYMDEDAPNRPSLVVGKYYRVIEVDADAFYLLCSESTEYHCFLKEDFNKFFKRTEKRLIWGDEVVLTFEGLQVVSKITDVLMRKVNESVV